jgi:hypothetical protein
MKLLATILSILTSLSILAQVELQHTPFKKEQFHQVFSYDDGGFTVFTGGEEGFGGKGDFVTYNSHGEIVFEKKNWYVIGSLRPTSSNPLEVFANSETKEIFFMGRGADGLVLRKVTDKGVVSEIVAEGHFGSVHGSAWTNTNTISALVKVGGWKEDRAVLIAFNTSDLSYTRSPLIADQLKGQFSLLHFIGTRESDMVFVGMNAGDSIQAEIVTIPPRGAIHTAPFTFNEPLDFVSSRSLEEVKIIGVGNGDLYFAVPSRTSFNHQTIYKVSESGAASYLYWELSNELKELEKELPRKDWFIEGGTLHSIGRAAGFYIYHPGVDEYLIYSSKGRNIMPYTPNWNEHSIGIFDDEKYIGPVNLGSQNDILLYFTGHAELDALKQRVFECGKENSRCFYDVKAIRNADGKAGFLVFSGDKVIDRTLSAKDHLGNDVNVERYHYENVRIVKY